MNSPVPTELMLPASYACNTFVLQGTTLEQQMDQTWGAGSIQIVGDNQLGAQTNDSSIVSVTLPSLTPLPDQSTVPHHQPSVTVVGPDLVVNSTQLAGPPVHNSMTAHNLTTAPSPEMSVRDTLDCSQELPNQSFPPQQSSHQTFALNHLLLQEVSHPMLQKGSVPLYLLSHQSLPSSQMKHI